MLLSLAYHLQVCSARKSILEYTKMVFDETDRKYAPLDENDCRRNSLKNLEACILLKKDRKRLTDFSKQFMTPKINSWNRVQRSDTVGGLGDYLDEIMRRSGRLVVSSSSAYNHHRSKRSTERAQDQVSLPAPDLSRSKRSLGINGNPCMRGKAVRTTILYGVDAETGDVVELLQNPGLHLYQTFFTRKCYLKKFFFLSCDVTYVEYMTAVFQKKKKQRSDDDDDDDKKNVKVVIRPVKIPTGCALSVNN
ncbi:uncharacterized protein LOC143459777 [Clavelina lepadiformis]|uniref:uncharacterized protein LOC143459777 n=1 Tax=Clavelina lepadiformis TaxID=159417 RepID=UPI004042BCEB